MTFTDMLLAYQRNLGDTHPDSHTLQARFYPAPESTHTP
jgi:hypothetical protein